MESHDAGYSQEKVCLTKECLGRHVLSSKEEFRNKETNCRLYFRNGPLVANAVVKCIVLKYLNLFMLIYWMIVMNCNEAFLVPYSQA